MEAVLEAATIPFEKAAVGRGTRGESRAALGSLQAVGAWLDAELVPVERVQALETGVTLSSSD